MKRKSPKALEKLFRGFTDEQLVRAWEAIGTHPDHRVKSGKNKGHIKLSWIKYSDHILDEQKRRKLAAQADADQTLAGTLYRRGRISLKQYVSLTTSSEISP